MSDKEERPASVPAGTTHSDNADAKTVSLSSHSVPETPENQVSVVPNPLETLAVQSLSDGDQNLAKEISVEEGKKDSTPPPKAVKQNPAPKTTPVNDWCNLAKGLGKRLSKKGEAFTLPSGEACIKIPNSVIEKNMKSWETFVLGQFYSDPPSQGTLHNIVNGIGSKHYRDIVVSKMEGFAFLFRIPNTATRARVINQRLWQIEGQTMFVDKWEPGVVPAKPELTSAPIWLELRKVPFQFFNEDGLERIAGLVGDPKYLHPMTKNKTNLEVAKVWTIIDPRVPLPEAVNIQFESGEISRVLVSSPWMPPVCAMCKEIGHVAKRCPSVQKVPMLCAQCNSKNHNLENCPLIRKQEPKGKKTRRGKSKENRQWRVVEPTTDPAKSPPVPQQTEQTHTKIGHSSLLGTAKDQVHGESSATPSYLQSTRPRSSSRASKSSNSDIQPDSSDVDTSDSELEEGELTRFEPDFQRVRNKKQFSGLKDNMGRGPKPN
ncbi:BnaC08g15190D [Brassica napus]|uniref:BnaC08g15190D protein n=2 Tax=Brassica napus TaxID=3708 RepID=A0A078H1A0_BRANA|nr:uncharacterized protein LOC111209004 [Brassica napus]CDY31224.1 BnaC08g15190D [Brassica napus]